MRFATFFQARYDAALCADQKRVQIFSFRLLMKLVLPVGSSPHRVSLDI